MSDEPSVQIGTPLAPGARRVMMLGSGELGKEVVIELQRLGVEVIAVDRYANAPAMQVAHRSHVINMMDEAALRGVIEQEQPHLVVPEIEAIATSALVALEAEGLRVIPTATAARLTMDREGIRRLAAEELGVRTSPFVFAATEDEYLAGVEQIGIPCVVKPVMSSSGKGQSTVRDQAADASSVLALMRRKAPGAGPTRSLSKGLLILTMRSRLLTVQHAGGVSFCPPIGHRQEGGDYQESWQPQPMSAAALAVSVSALPPWSPAELGGFGLFGVEFFVKGDEVYFSEVSPRPHDTGMVTHDQSGSE